MKIVKDGLYMYNDGEAFFIVKADGGVGKYGPAFSGEVIYSEWEQYQIGYFDDDWANCKFKRIDNKITCSLED